MPISNFNKNFIMKIFNKSIKLTTILEKCDIQKPIIFDSKCYEKRLYECVNMIKSFFSK